MDSFYGARMEVPIDLKVVGACTENDTEDIYVPLAFAISPGYFETDGNSYSGENEVTEAAADMESDGAQAYWNSEGLDYYLCRMTSFSTCRFTLDSARDLDAFRNFLADNGVSQPGILGSNRLTIVLSDQSFVETVGGLGRLISFCGILFPALFGAVCLLGFVISWLMVEAGGWNLPFLGDLEHQGTVSFLSFLWSRPVMSGGKCYWSADRHGDRHPFRMDRSRWIFPVLSGRLRSLGHSLGPGAAHGSATEKE